MTTIQPSIKNKIQSIVSVFETSSLAPRYDIVTCLSDGPVIKGKRIKQVTYGKHQTTEFGNLKGLIKMYVDRNGRFAKDFTAYLPLLGMIQHPMADNVNFKLLLKLSAEDPIMRQAQDDFFDLYYWQPAMNFFAANLFTLPLSMAVIYDSYVHSGGIPSWLRDDFAERTPLNKGDEKKWITAYVNARDYWLEHHPDKILRNTDYRTDAWQDAIKENNWDLKQPVLCKFNSDKKPDWVRIP